MRPAAGAQRIRSAAAVELRPLPGALHALTIGTGIIDAVCFLALGEVFTANMTGNVALLGFAIAGVSGLSVSALATSLGCFLAGAVAGGRYAAWVADRKSWWLTSVLVAEAVLVAVAAVPASSVDPDRRSGATYVTIAILAVAMGLRNATTRRLAIPDLTTTVLTTTLTNLAAGSRLAGGAGTRSVRRTAAVVAMLAGAVIGALLLRDSVVVPLLLAAALTLLALTLHLTVTQARTR